MTRIGCIYYTLLDAQPFFLDTVEKHKRSLAIFLPSRNVITLNVTTGHVGLPMGLCEVDIIKDSYQEH